jgi:hypothetical protein
MTHNILQNNGMLLVSKKNMLLSKDQFDITDRSYIP